MAWYWLPFIATLLFAILNNLLPPTTRSNRQLKLFIVLVLIATLTVFVGGRTEYTNLDYSTYLEWFERINSAFTIELQKGKDIGFIFLYKITSFFFNQDTYFFTFIALLSLVCKYYFAKKISDEKFYGWIFLLFISRLFIVQEFTQIRAGLAIGLASCGILLFLDNKKKLAYCLLIIASFIHLSALIIPLCYLAIILLNLSQRKYLLFILPILGIILGSFSYNVIMSLNISRLNVYLSGNYSTHSISLLSSYYLFRFSLFYALLFLYKSQTLDKKSNIIIGILGISLFIHAFFAWNDAISLRATEVLALFNLSAVAIFARKFTNQSQVFIKIIIILVSIIFYSSSLKLVLPYSNYFFNYL